MRPPAALGRPFDFLLPVGVFEATKRVQKERHEMTNNKMFLSLLGKVMQSDSYQAAVPLRALVDVVCRWHFLQTVLAAILQL